MPLYNYLFIKLERSRNQAIKYQEIIVLRLFYRDKAYSSHEKCTTLELSRLCDLPCMKHKHSDKTLKSLIQGHNYITICVCMCPLSSQNIHPLYYISLIRLIYSLNISFSGSVTTIPLKRIISFLHVSAHICNIAQYVTLLYHYDILTDMVCFLHMTLDQF